MINVLTAEDMQQFSFLRTMPGEVESGFVRYGAAMYFHQRGMISDKTLEIYRACSRLDNEDPALLLRQLGLSYEVQMHRSQA